VTTQQRDAFYAAAAAGLRMLDSRERTPRRFGADADARWVAFRGGLSDADRIDVMLRDAAVTWGAAFSPAEAFNVFGIAQDEPFGPDWKPLGPLAAKRHLGQQVGSTGIGEMALLLGVPDHAVTAPVVTPSTRLAVAGGAALVAIARIFAGRSELSWSDQVLAIASSPAHRQLAALLAVATGAAARTRLALPGDDQRAVLTAVGFKQIDAAVVSADAEGACGAFARRAAGVV
jgi:hypothetical protein